MAEHAALSDGGARHATCPFCALLCDDLSLAPAPAGGFTVLGNGCARAAVDYARAPLPAVAEIDGQAVPLERALGRAAELLGKARHTHIGGLATDVDGTRAALELAERCGASLDHLHGDAQALMMRLLQTRGWFSTTLSEVRNRADLVLMVGLDLAHSHAAFVRRCLAPPEALLPARLAARRARYLGATPPRDVEGVSSLRCTGAALPSVLQSLLVLLKGERLDARRVGGIARAALATLAGELAAAEYSAIVFAPGALGADGDIALAALLELVDHLNRTRRAAVLALGGDDGGQSAQSACAWLTGYPLRLRCGERLHYDPASLGTTSLLASGSCDTLLWIDAYGRHSTPPPASDPARTVVLGACRPHTTPAVFIAVGTPGLDHAARLVRTDNVVTLALAGQRDVGLPAVAAVLAALGERLESC